MARCHGLVFKVEDSLYRVVSSHPGKQMDVMLVISPGITLLWPLNDMFWGLGEKKCFVCLFDCLFTLSFVDVVFDDGCPHLLLPGIRLRKRWPQHLLHQHAGRLLVGPHHNDHGKFHSKLQKYIYLHFIILYNKFSKLYIVIVYRELSIHLRVLRHYLCYNNVAHQHPFP